MREFLATLKATFRELFPPRMRDLDDDERQSVDEATAARTQFIRDHRPDEGGDEMKPQRDWDWLVKP